jgi:hypothetical protein
VAVAGTLATHPRPMAPWPWRWARQPTCRGRLGLPGKRPPEFPGKVSTDMPAGYQWGARRSERPGAGDAEAAPCSPSAQYPRRPRLAAVLRPAFEVGLRVLGAPPRRSKLRREPPAWAVSVHRPGVRRPRGQNGSACSQPAPLRSALRSREVSSLGSAARSLRHSVGGRASLSRRVSRAAGSGWIGFGVEAALGSLTGGGGAGLVRDQSSTFMTGVSG